MMPKTALIVASLQASVRGLSANGIADLSTLMARLNPSNRAESSCYPISSRSLRPMASGSSGRRQAGLKPMMPLAACEGST